ncbi:MAG TPA: hypothetical protein EYG21_08480 [Nitrospinaceae bacterium]|jgi:23S rRNA pseudoU1915 N3-methylase RlmH|nr:hypothetical protein [Nitrospinaceae bacterium]
MTDIINSPMEAAMFDHILFEAELPKKGLPSEISTLDMSGVEFQTTDLSKSMDTWSVSTAGQLFFHENESSFVKDESYPMGGYFQEKHKGIKRVEETKSIHFYRVFEGKDKDYWVSYDALFRKGDLVSVDLNSVEEVDQKTRKEAQQKAKELAEEIENRVTHKSSLISKPFKLLTGVFLVCLHFVGRNVAKLHSKL